PPPTHGSVGIVVSPEKWDYYNLEVLPEEAQERQKRLGERLEELEKISRDIFTRGIHIFDKDTEVKDMIQQLAQDYYQYHQTAARAPKKRAIPHTPTLFDDGFADTPSCLPIQAVIASILNAKSLSIQWKNPNDHAPFFLYEKP